MIGYSKGEIISSTKVSKNFGTILNMLKRKKLEKVAISRNNRLEAVILPIEEYETIKEVSNLDEYKELYNIIKEREDTSIDDYISFDSILKEYGLKEDEL